jgi:hypothetical protein
MYLSCLSYVTLFDAASMIMILWALNAGGAAAGVRDVQRRLL